MTRSLLAAALAATAFAAPSDGAIVSFTSRAAWSAAPSSPQASLFAAPVQPIVSVESLDGLTPTATGFAGGTSWHSWSVAASVGAVQAQDGAVRAEAAGSSLQLTFGGAASAGFPGVLGVALDLGFLDASGSRVDGRLYVRLASGSSIVKTFTAADSFVGFWSSDLGAPIAGLRIQPLGTAATVSSVGMQGLELATVPAPGAVSLLAATALIGSGRRRR
jgi:hypothetical protein